MVWQGDNVEKNENKKIRVTFNDYTAPEYLGTFRGFSRDTHPGNHCDSFRCATFSDGAPPGVRNLPPHRAAMMKRVSDCLSVEND